MAVPHAHTSDNNASNLTSTATHQFAVWYDLAGELRVGRIERGVQRWGVNHDEYTFVGAPRTAMALPVAADSHNYSTIAVDGLGKLHVWANMHVDPLRAVASTTAHTTNGWLATAGWVSATADFPGMGARCTYPKPIRFPDGTLVLHMRDGIAGTGSGVSDSHLWRRGPAATTWSGPELIWQGLNVPGAGGPSGPPDSSFDWSAYVLCPVVESPRGPNPGRMHVVWMWRRDTQIERAIPSRLSYAYSDDKGLTWFSIGGVQAVLPFTPLNNPAFLIGLEDDANGGYLNGGGITVDDSGLPHIIQSAGPSWWIRRENNQWVQSQIPFTFHGASGQGRGLAYWLHGHLWMLKTAGVSALRQWRPQLWQVSADPGATFRMGGEVDSFGDWEASADPEAYRQFGTIEALVPDGNRPRVYVFPHGARVRQAA
jgi:hypothetical protein